MSLLRILRNLAVLVIFAVGGFSLMPRAVAAQSTCHPWGLGLARTPANSAPVGVALSIIGAAYRSITNIVRRRRNATVAAAGITAALNSTLVGYER
jgi:hypothetical protein